MKDNKKSAYELFQKGVALLESGNPAQAALILEKAFELEPGKGSICEALGRAYYNYGRFDNARVNFSRAIKIDPTNHYAHFGLALCLEQLGFHQRSLGHIKLARAMSPVNEDYKKVQERLESALGR